VERFTPIVLNHIKMLGILLQSLDLLLIEMRLNEVAEIGDKQNFSGSVPKERMLLHLFEQ